MPEHNGITKDKKNPSVLITGGRGLVGSYLTSILTAEGFNVSYLSREAGNSGRAKIFRWDPAKRILNPEIFDGVDYVVHLAGANIGAKLWTTSRRNEIRTSRIDSANFLFETLSSHDIKLKAFVSASGTGYYGSVTSDRIFSEEDPPGEDFLATTCRLWEESADLFGKAGIRTVKIRTAVVVAKNDIALTRLMNPARFGLVVRLGSGKQYFPWIHIADLCNIYLKAIEDPCMQGAYNAVAPEAVNHDDFIRSMARIMRRPVIFPHIPAWALRAVMGEMAGIILEGSRISAEKIISAGYNFRFVKIGDALKDIIED